MKGISSVVIILMTLAILSCSASKSDEERESSNPNKIGINNCKALFIGSYDGSKSTKSGIALSKAAETTNSLYQVSQDGSIQLVPFLDDQGEEIPVNVSTLILISSKIVGIEFSYNNQNYTVLGYIETGILYDMKGYTLTSMIPGSNDSEIIAIYQGEIRRVNLETKTYTPINNPAVDPVENAYHCWMMFTADAGIVYDYTYPLVTVGTKLMARSTNGDYHQLFDLDGVAAPVKIPFTSTNEGDNVVSGSYWNVYSHVSSILSTNGKVYVYNGGGGENNILRIQHNYMPHDADRYIVEAARYCKTSANADGTINYTWTTKDMTYLMDMGYPSDGSILYPRIKGSKVYGFVGNKLMMGDIVDGTSLQEIYESPYSVAKWRYIGDDVYFTVYKTATSIETYKLVSTESVPTLVSSSDMEIGTIVEFTL